MKHYRVTLETLAEQYVYEVDAPNKTSAKIQALELAIQDGFKEGVRTQWFTVERLD